MHDGDQDTLLYSFELNIGDTLQESYIYSNWSSTPEIVTGIDSIETDVGWLKRFHFENSYFEYLIEGIGHGKGFIDWMELPLNYATRMICYSQNNNIQFDTGNGECYFTLSVEEHNISFLRFYPNPTSEKMYFELPQMQNSRIYIYDQLGKSVHVPLVFSGDQYELDISELQMGIYLVWIQAEDMNFHGKFMKE